MGKNKTESTQTTTQALPQNQQTNVDTLMQGALDYFNTGGREFFPGDVVADFDPLQTQGQNNIVNFAGGMGTDLAGKAINANNALLDPAKMLDPSQNPYFTNVIDDLLQRNTQNLTENVLPSVRSGGTSSGQFGGSATGIGEALATDRFHQGNIQQQNTMGLDQQRLGMQGMLQAIMNSPQMFNLGMAPGQAIAGVGEARQNQAQNEIKGDVARHDFEQNEPIQMLELLKMLTGGMGEYGGTSTTNTSQTAESSPINTALGAGLTMASMMNPLMSMFAPGGMGSTGVGGLMQMLQPNSAMSAFGANPSAQSLFNIPTVPGLGR